MNSPPGQDQPAPAVPPDSARLLFLMADIGVVLYLILDIAAQSLPPHYNPISTAESDLAVGPYGYIMAINFLNRGLLSLAFLYAFLRTVAASGVDSAKFRTGVYLLGVWGVGALLLAAFPTDVPSSPVSWHGAIHLVVALLAFIGGAFGTISISMKLGDYETLRGARRFALALAAVAVLFLLLLFGLPFVAPHLASKIGGVTERVLIGSVLTWILYVSVYLVRRKETLAPVP